MADVKISALPAASALTGTELVPIVQGGVTVQSTPAAFVSNGTLAVSGTNLSYTGTLTGGTGVVNIGSGQLVKDASGNLGLGVTPSAWGAGYSAFDYGADGSVMSPYTMRVISNAYYNSGWKYKATSGASYYATSQGTHSWYTAPSGTAGNAITFTQAMTLDANNILSLGANASAWNPGNIAVELPQYGVLAFQNAGGSIAANAYFSTTGWKYTSTNYAAKYDISQSTGGHYWRVAPSGTAGAAITFIDAMTLDASGNLGLGVTPSAWSAGFKAFDIGASSALVGSSGQTDIFNNAYFNGTNTIYKTTNAAALFRSASGGGFQWYTAPSGTAGTAITFTQAMTLDASGNLLVGQTSSGGAVGVNANATQIGLGTTTISHVLGTISGAAYIYFGYNATTAGSITQDGTTAVLYNTTSDQRLKENIVDAPEASALIDAIQVRSFDWKSDGSHQRYGMVAQELHAVAPEAVHKPSDPEEMMAVDYSKLVPMLVKEIQSLRARVAQLESN